MSPRRKFKCAINGERREFLLLYGEEIINDVWRRLSHKGLRLVDIKEENELYEGLEIEKEGAWFEVFMYDHVHGVYFIERSM